MLSGGNFHGEPVAFTADVLALAIAEIGSLSERRMAVLVDPKMSGLPPFLVENSGLNSGFMIAQVTAAALVSENKTHRGALQRRLHPHLGESGRSRQHGHACGAPASAHGRQCRRGWWASNCSPRPRASIFTAPPLLARRSSVHAAIRAEVPFYSADRYFAPDIEAAQGWVSSGRFAHSVDTGLPSRAPG